MAAWLLNLIIITFPFQTSSSRLTLITQDLMHFIMNMIYRIFIIGHSTHMKHIQMHSSAHHWHQNKLELTVMHSVCAWNLNPITSFMDPMPFVHTTCPRCQIMSIQMLYYLLTMTNLLIALLMMNLTCCPSIILCLQRISNL